MNRSEMKRALEQSLPYPRMTAEMKRRLETVCQALPEKTEEQMGETGFGKGKRYRKEAWAQAEEARGRGRFAAFQTAGAVLAAAAVCFAVFALPRAEGPNSLTPGAPDSSIASSAGEKSAVSQEESSALFTAAEVVLENWQRRGNELSVTLTCPALPDSALQESPSRTRLSCILSLPDGAQLKPVPSGEELAAIDTPVGEPVTATYSFEGLPAEGEEDTAVFTAYSFPPDVTMVMPDGTEQRPMVLAEYTLNLSTGEAVPTDHCKEMGYKMGAPEEWIRLANAELHFVNHMFSPAMVTGRGGFHSSESEVGHDPEDEPFYIGVSFYCDTLEELPYEAQLVREGAVEETAPLSGLADTAKFDLGRFVERKDYGILVLQRGADAHMDSLRQSIQSIYHVHFYLPEENDGSYSCRILNAETGEVLFDASVPSYGEEEEGDVEDSVSSIPESCAGGQAESIDSGESGGREVSLPEDYQEEDDGFPSRPFAECAGYPTPDPALYGEETHRREE